MDGQFGKLPVLVARYPQEILFLRLPKLIVALCQGSGVSSQAKSGAAISPLRFALKGCTFFQTVLSLAFARNSCLFIVQEF